eukprot:scaffold44599_cov42-Attheya_sp.AAC.1
MSVESLSSFDLGSILVRSCLVHHRHRSSLWVFSPQRSADACMMTPQRARIRYATLDRLDSTQVKICRRDRIFPSHMMVSQPAMTAHRDG